MKKQINETKRMQQLAGILKENLNILREDIEDDIDDDLLSGDFKNKEDQIAYLEYVIEHCQKLIKQIKAQIDKGETFDS
jgi:flagellar biosynthesis chaperone FliJ